MALAISLVPEEEEGLVSSVVNMRHADGTAESDAKLVLAQRIALDQEIVSRIHLLVPQEFPSRSMIAIGAASGSDIDDAARDPTEFRKIIVRLHLELLDIIDNRRVVVVAKER